MFAFLINTAQVFVLIVLLDMLWLKWAYSRYYKKMYNRINNGVQKSVKYKILPAISAWMLLAMGIYYFGVISTDGVLAAALSGSLFGLTVYGVYNSTNYATLNRYDLKTAAIDTAWGTGLCMVASILFKLVKG